MIINSLQKFEPKDWSKLTTKNHLGAMYGEMPILISDVLDNIYDVNLGLDLDRFADQFETHDIDKDSPFEWLLNSQSAFKNIPLIAYYDSTLSSQPAKAGIGGSTFYMEFADDIFSSVDTIAPANYGKEKYILKIQGEATPNGSNWIYPVRLTSGDSNLFVPVSMLTGGVRYVKMFAAVEQTLSQRGSNSINHSSPLRMQNRCTMIRADYEVPGNMIEEKENAPLGFFFVDATGKRHTTWIGKLDYDFMIQFKRQKAMMLLYAQNNKTQQGTYDLKGESGYEIKMGSGLYEQIAPSNVYYYNNFDIDVLSNILLDLSVGKLPEDMRRFVLGTGEFGMVQFHKAVEGKAGTFLPNRTEIRIDGTQQDMRYGGQFKRYRFVNGIEVELVLIPFLDDKSLCADTHPDGGQLSSYEYLILDFGTQKGKPNIQKVAIKGQSDKFKYIPGLRDPFSPDNGDTRPGMTVSTVDGYKVMRSHIGGLKVHNPLRIARYLPLI